MLPRSQRLSVEQFNVVMEKGRVFHSSLFQLRALSGPDSTRISAVVPQKLVKTAVGRNSLRRSMYECLESLISAVEPHIHGVVFAKQPALTAEPEELARGMRDVFVKAGLLK